ncbi:NUDIX hydrolase [Plantactinospora sp. CA-290183]|uniref:NUDIX hydrolase n=1 Tax=Plantactinospora sp. CA-290183 TaxID=3240006 RepID=UPI003D92CA4C
MRRRRIGAYGLCRDADRVLLVRGSATAPFPGVWRLPGGGVGQGEHPAAAVRREFAEETGLPVEVSGLRTVVSDVARLAAADAVVAEHTDRVLYDVVPVGDGDGDAARRPDVDRSAWVSPAGLACLTLMPFTAELLGRPVSPLPAGVLPRSGGPASAPVGLQRFSAYGLATDPAGRVLLTLIAPGYPGAGHWHLPGGGTDHGEQPTGALLRELVEESGQLGRITELLTVSHRHNPAALGPEGRPVDWHVVRVIYRVVVESPTVATVTETAGGSTERAAWFPAAEVGALPLSEVAREATAWLAG